MQARFLLMFEEVLCLCLKRWRLRSLAPLHVSRHALNNHALPHNLATLLRSGRCQK